MTHLPTIKAQALSRRNVKDADKFDDMVAMGLTSNKQYDNILIAMDDYQRHYAAVSASPLRKQFSSSFSRSVNKDNANLIFSIPDTHSVGRQPFH